MSITAFILLELLLGTAAATWRPSGPLYTHTTLKQPVAAAAEDSVTVAGDRHWLSPDVPAGQATQQQPHHHYHHQQEQQSTKELELPSTSSPSAAPGRQLLQASTAPTLCGKLGTYIPNLDDSADGSMFGFSVAPSSDGSVIAVGAPMFTSDATVPGAAMVLKSLSSATCEYTVTPVPQPPGSYRYFGAQVTLSKDGTTMVVADGVEGIKSGTSVGNRPVVHVYRRASNGDFIYFQKLNCAPRKATASAMALSTTSNGKTILVSFSVADGFQDKRGSAQVFVVNGTSSTAKYAYLQDLALLNMPAGVSVQYGASSTISSNGLTIAVATALSTDQFNKYTYMYRKDTATGRFRIVSSIIHGEYWGDSWAVGRGVGLTDDNAVAMSQTGRFVLRVENAQLVVYEWSGSGMSMTWKRRCQLTAPDGFTFRTTGDALSIMEVSSSRVKFAAGAYTGVLGDAPEQMAVFLYYLNAATSGSCPFRAAEKHVHNDPYSNYGASVSITAKGNLLVVGAPSAWDNNMAKQYGAVYAIDISTVADDGLTAITVTAATNTNAGCVNGRDANGNACVDKQAGNVLCKDVTKSDGSVVHYGPIGCTPTPAPPSFWTTTVSDAGSPTFATSSVSAYSSIAPSVKGGVGVPSVSTTWLSNQVQAAATASYYGVPTTSVTAPKTSVVAAAGWPTSVSAALGGLSANTASTWTGAVSTPSTMSVLNTMLSGVGSMLRNALAGLSTGSSGTSSGASSGTSSGTNLGLPAGAVITNPGVLTG